MNICTWPEYSCKVLVELPLYFELQKKIVAVCRDIKLQFFGLKFVFLHSSKYNIFSFEISTVPLECLYVLPPLRFNRRTFDASGAVSRVD
jgi:hypothetical protein